MKKALSLLLILAVFCSISITCFASGFNEAAVKSSPMYYKDSSTNGWKVIGIYNKEYSNVEVDIIGFLSSGYVEKGWGPDLRVTYYDKNKSNYDKVDALRVTVNDKIYSFENFEQGDQSCYIYGGEVMREFLNSLSEAVFISIDIDHVSKDGISYTATISPVTKREMSDLAELGSLFELANLWDPTVTTDMSSNDIYYNASIAENTSFDISQATASVDWTDLIGYWTSRNGSHTFEMKSNGGYVTTVPVVPHSGDCYEMVDGIIYKYFERDPSNVTPNLKFTMISDTEIEVYSYQTKTTYTLYKRR